LTEAGFGPDQHESKHTTAQLGELLT